MLNYSPFNLAQAINDEETIMEHFNKEVVAPRAETPTKFIDNPISMTNDATIVLPIPGVPKMNEEAIKNETVKELKKYIDDSISNFGLILLSVLFVIIINILVVLLIIS